MVMVLIGACIPLAFGRETLGNLETRLRYFCSPYYQDSALFPFIEQLGRAVGFAESGLAGAAETYDATGRLKTVSAALRRARGAPR
jgi:hypothetical protein